MPTLRCGDVVVADNLASQKRRSVRDLLTRVEAKLLFLPQYSPDLNPIEQVFAKLKHLLRKAAARTREAASDTIGTLLNTYTVEECANHFRNSGYGPA